MRRINIVAAVVVIGFAGALTLWLMQPGTDPQTTSLVSVALVVIAAAALVATLLVDPRRLAPVRADPVPLWVTVGALAFVAVVAMMSGLMLAAAAVGLAALGAIVARLRARDYTSSERSAG